MKIPVKVAHVVADDMWLVYQDSYGGNYYVHWANLEDGGVPQCPYSDEDMELVGWTRELIPSKSEVELVNHKNVNPNGKD